MPSPAEWHEAAQVALDREQGKLCKCDCGCDEPKAEGDYCEDCAIAIQFEAIEEMKNKWPA